MLQSVKIAVVGARGMLGQHVMFVGGSKLMPVTQRLNNHVDVNNCFAKLAPNVIINCAGCVASESIQMWHSNSVLPHLLCDYTEQHGSMMINVSTNAIFAADNERLWTVTDEPSPITPYEVSKYCGEDSRALNVRVSFVGRSQKDSIFNRLMNGQPFYDRKWNGVTALTLAKYLVDTAESCVEPMNGIQHFHSLTTITFSELAMMLKSTSANLGIKQETKLLSGIRAPAFDIQIKEYLDILPIML
jgi:dTDP-4-dehydrorhamnose reductase